MTFFRPDSADGTERTSGPHQGHTRASLPSRHGYHGSGKVYLGSCEAHRGSGEAHLGSGKALLGSFWLM
jgi:hypothetical protein